MPPPSPGCQGGQLRSKGIDPRGHDAQGVSKETVPTFVPTTKPYRVRRNIKGPLESLAGQGVCLARPQFIALGANC